MTSIRKYIFEQVAKRALSIEDAKHYLTELSAIAEPTEQSIAIIGMAGRFPKAENLQQFWDVLLRGESCIRDYPEARRKDLEPILHNPHYADFLLGDTFKPEDCSTLYRPAGYLDEIDKFDAGFFGIAPTEAIYMDPYQRLTLEVAWEAMESAGYGGSRLNGTPTGVFMGKDATNHSMYRHCSIADPMQLTGGRESIIATRIAHLFDFRGPCLMLDSACSAGLVSVHYAIQSLLNGECETALAGGINLSVTGAVAHRYQHEMNMTALDSADGMIRAFDARANGTVWGEGVGVVLLKPLTAALADRDPILAVIKGSAINNDGASSGLTTPKAETQEEVIVKAWLKANIDPSTLSYIEAHGTGTVLGDPIEFKGLTNAFQRFTHKRQFCAVGSLKTNMGHLVAASGVASLFKIVQSLQHKMLAPTINFSKPNPYINFTQSPLYVNDIARPWHADGGPRRAAVSSFGFSHTNCHVVVEEAPERPAYARYKSAYILTVSAKSSAALRAYVERYITFCQDGAFNLADVCFTSNVGRGHYSHRLAIMAYTETELRERLALAIAVIKGVAEYEDIHFGQHRVVSERKRQLGKGEITPKTMKTLARMAAATVVKLGRGSRRHSQLYELCQYYVDGAEIAWNQLYTEEVRQYVVLPTYPFQRVRLWAIPKSSQLGVLNKRLHPLVEQFVGLQGAALVFESLFDTDMHPLMTEFNRPGRMVLSGSTYLEMIRFAATYVKYWEQVEFSNICCSAPLVLEVGESRLLRIYLTETETGLDFSIESQSVSGQEHKLHAQGHIRALDAVVVDDLDLDALKAQAVNAITILSGANDAAAWQLGQSGDLLKAAWQLGEHILACYLLPPTHKQMRLYPSLLEHAVQLSSQSMEASVLPFICMAYRYYAPCETEMYCYLKRNLLLESGAALTYDIVLTDAYGKVLGEMQNYLAKPLDSLPSNAMVPETETEYWRTVWQPLLMPATPVTPAGSLVLLGGADDNDLVQLAHELALLGVPTHTYVLSDAPEADVDNFATLLQEAYWPGVVGIVFATDFVASPLPVEHDLRDAAAFARRSARGVEALFHLTTAVLQSASRLPWGIAVLTRDAYAIKDHEYTHPLAAASSALGVVIAREHPQLPCRIIDADRVTSLCRVAQQLLATIPGLPVALRAATLYVRQLQSYCLPVSAPLVLSTQGAYLLTDGLSNLALELAQFLADQGAQHLVLLDRSALPARETWASLAEQTDDRVQAKRFSKLHALAQQLSSLAYMQVDIADYTALQTALAHLPQQHPICGVLHLTPMAGGYMAYKDYRHFVEVLRSQLAGLRNLLELLPTNNLDFCAFFSTVAAFTGGEGQGAAAAVNAFIEAIVSQRKTLGCRLQVINWPNWQGVDRSSDSSVHADRLFTPLAADKAGNALQHIIAQQPASVIPSQPNAPVMLQHMDTLPFVLAPALLRRLSSDAAAITSAKAHSNDIAIQVLGKRPQDLSAAEIVLSRLYATVLGVNEIDVHAKFQDMGGNAMIAIRLQQLLEAHLPDDVDIADIFAYPSIDEMAAYIESKSANPAPPPSAPASIAWANLVEQILAGTTSIDALLEQWRPKK